MLAFFSEKLETHFRNLAREMDVPYRKLLNFASTRPDALFTRSELEELLYLVDNVSSGSFGNLTKDGIIEHLKHP